MTDTAHAKSVPLIVVVARINAATIEVHVVRVVGTSLYGRPVVAVRTGIFQQTVGVVTVADSGKLYSRRLHHAVRDVVLCVPYIK